LLSYFMGCIALVRCVLVLRCDLTGVVEMEHKSSISTLSPVGSNIGTLYQKLYIQPKCAPEDGRVCRPKHVDLI